VLDAIRPSHHRSCPPALLLFPLQIGSVPPNDAVNCVRDVLFRDVHFTLPIKAVYIKTNPGNSGSGVIHNITYTDMTASDAVWWAIYIGPQQQKQPDGDGPGCMFYPLSPNCPTNPRVPITDVTIRNFAVTGTLLSPGIIRCNESAPCTGFVFDNVVVDKWDKWPFADGYKVENVFGVVSNSSPAPAFATETDAPAAAPDAEWNGSEEEDVHDDDAGERAFHEADTAIRVL
jgi:hypothetical protein